MDAPTRIWAWPHFDGWITGDWSANTYHDDRTVEYILATEHARLMAEKDEQVEALQARVAEARNAALEDAAKACDDEADKYDDDVKWNGHPKYIASCKAAAGAIRERADAIRAMKDAPTDTPPSSR